MSFVRPFLRNNSSASARATEDRAADADLADIRPSLDCGTQPDPFEACGASQPSAKTVIEMLNHAAEALDYLQTRCREIEDEAEQAALRSAQAVAEAQSLADRWEARASASDAHIQELEARLADADQTAMELRSRLVCLYGKLAASSDTVRFRSLSRALGKDKPSRMRPPVQAQQAAVN